MKLRPYQEVAVESVLVAIEDNPEACPILWAGTGTGKSVMGAALSSSLGRTLVITHRAELVKQNHAKLPKNMKGSIFSSGLGKKDASGEIIFAGIQTIRNHWHKLPKLDAVLIDECHVFSRAYDELMGKIRKTSPKARLLGMTATPFDGRGVWLHMLEKHRLFSHIAAEIPVGEMLAQGYLSPLVPYNPSNKIDASSVEVSRSTHDYVTGQIQKLTDTPEKVKQHCAEIKEITWQEGRSSIIVFCTGKEHTQHVAAELGGEYILDDTPQGKRDDILARFRAGKIRYLCACDVLLTGFDAPIIDCIVNLRPTRSPVVHVQLWGRGMRLHPESGKSSCLAVDFTDAVDHFGPIDEMEGKPPTTSSGQAPVKVCPSCFQIILAGLRKCPSCGHEFEFLPKEQHFDPTTGIIISGVRKNEDGSKTYPIERMEFEIRHTGGGVPAMVISYFSPGRKTAVSTEYLNMWHRNQDTAYAAQVKWINRLIKQGGAPLNAQEALARAELGALKLPKNVTVKPGSPYPVRLGY